MTQRQTITLLRSTLIRLANQASTVAAHMRPDPWRRVLRMEIECADRVYNSTVDREEPKRKRKP